MLHSCPCMPHSACHMHTTCCWWPSIAMKGSASMQGDGGFVRFMDATVLPLDALRVMNERIGVPSA